MKKLLSYLNSLNDQGRRSFCENCGTSEGYLRKAVSTNQSIRPILCVAIERHSKGQVTRIDLHPDDWHLIWPELLPKQKQKAAA